MTEINPSVSTSEPPSRRFHLSDEVILMAAMTVGLALGKVAFLQSYSTRPVQAGFLWYRVADAGVTAAYPAVACLSLATFALRLRRPRPPLLRLVFQPGFVACGASVECLALGLIVSSGKASLSNFAWVESQFTGYMVLGAWLTLCVVGGWKPERSWIDRLGRALGVLWIAMPLIILSGFL